MLGTSLAGVRIRVHGERLPDARVVPGGDGRCGGRVALEVGRPEQAVVYQNEAEPGSSYSSFQTKPESVRSKK